MLHLLFQNLKHRSARPLSLMAAAAALCAAAAPSSGRAESGLQPGDTCPPFSELASTDDVPIGLDTFSSADVLIVVFTSNRCPYAIDYEERLAALGQFCERSEGKVALLAINSNPGREESLEIFRQRAREAHFTFPCVKDADQSVARSFGAVYTPEFFVFDRQRRLMYRGALDDATDPSRATVNYARSW